MKKLVLFTALAGTATAAFAQDAVVGARQVTATKTPMAIIGSENVAAKTTGGSDTGQYTLFLYIPKGTANGYTRQVFDTSSTARPDRALPLDSGYMYGTNPTGSRGFAEQMYFRYKADTGMRILGFRTVFTGRVQSSSTKQVTFNVWRKGVESSAGTKKYNEGLPTTSLGSLPVSARALGIGLNGLDTFKTFFFPNSIALTAADSDFYIGYSMPSYSWTSLSNDTFGMRASRQGAFFGYRSYLRSGSGSNATDTIHANQTAFMDAAGIWHDVLWEYYGGGTLRHLSIVPIVQLTGSKFTFGINDGFSRNNLTFFGNFPNPAVNATKVRFALKNTAEVTLELTDMNGRTIRRESFGKMGAGQHDVDLSVASLAAGNYVYTIHTSEGDAIASQLSVVK